MPSSEDAYPIPETVQQNIMQLFIEVPGLTEANGQYEAEVLRRSDSKLVIKFGVKPEAKDTKTVTDILHAYIFAISSYNIEGVEMDEQTGHLIVDDSITLATVMNAYLEENPHQLDESAIEGVGLKIGALITSITNKAPLPLDEEDTNIVRGLGMARQFFELARRIPKHVLGLSDYKTHGQVNESGSIEIGFTIGEHATQQQKEGFQSFINHLDGTCAERPHHFGYNTQTERYMFATAQELYDFMSEYLGGLIPEKVKADPRKATFRMQEIMACEEALEAIFDDFVPNMDMSKRIEDFSKPRSVNAVAMALRTFLNHYNDTSAEDTETFYINCDEQNGEFIFTIGCSNFTVHNHPDEKLEIMTELFDALHLYRPSGVAMGSTYSGDNIRIYTHDLSTLLPLFKSFYEEHDLGGPEDVEFVSVDKNGFFNPQQYKDNLKTLVSNFDSATKLDEIFQWVPMRPYASLDAVKAAYLIQNHAQADISYSGLEATVLQEYEGGDAIAQLSMKQRGYFLH